MVTFDNVNEYLRFEVNGRLFAVPMSSIVVILQATKPVKIPEFPDYIEGTVTYEGNIVPVINSRIRFGYPDAEITNRNIIIICEAEGKAAGILIDTILDFRRLAEGELKPPPNLNEDASSRYLSGVFVDHGDTLCYVIDLFKMFNESDSHIIPDYVTDDGIADEEQEEE
ncbi:MAG: purine-binding chemotaxis protein CheW [Ruminococcus sp.]|nr:purine-binding chemotaxis protein CheW [Ruminococcus sp.]